MKPRDLGLLVLLAAIWGSSYLFIRIAGPVLGPWVLMGWRVTLAAMTLWFFAGVTHNQPDVRQYWKQFLVLGVLNNAMPFVLIATSVIHLNASIAAILNATTPLFAALVGAAWIGEPLGLRKSVGLLLGIVGVAALVGWSPLPLSAPVLLAVGAALLAAFSYGLAAVYARVRMQGVPPIQTAVGQLTGSTLILLPIAVVAWPAVAPPPGIIAAVAVLATVCTAFAYLIYFRLIASAGSTQAATVTFLVPFFSLLWGVTVLHEPLNAGVFTGLALILVSVWLVLAPFRAPLPIEQPEARAS